MGREISNVMNNDLNSHRDSISSRGINRREARVE